MHGAGTGAMLPAMSERLTRRPPSLAAICLLAAACGPLSPETQQANAYVKRLQPLLVENGHVAERVLLLAAEVYNDPKADADALAQSWTRDVVPLAEHLHHQAQLVEAPAPWVAAHADLVDIWGDRAKAYRSLSEALVLTDQEGWTAARAEVTQLKRKEEDWFKETNTTLATHGLWVDPTP